MSPARRTQRGHPANASDPLWYKDAVIYELRVGAFQDSDGDGVGDFRGLTSRLDYLQDLGVTALWLLPFCPSPLRDDGYDISDYQDVRPDCGTLDDFKVFLREAHKRDLRVITELVINHTSDQHPWFQRARRAPPGSKHRDFYVWSDTPNRYREARVIFKDFEPGNWSWDPMAQAYYWHRFFHHQPDLNFESPEVRKAVFGFLDFWMDLGVDGLRLDAIPYLFEREGTNCENLPETHAFLKDLRSHIDGKYVGRMLLAEANQWPEDAVAYFGKNDECHMSFHFPVMPRLFMALHMEDRYPIIDILDQTPAIHAENQWALFLRNHDELTLEMVTDEERDYMYRVYADDRQARINLGIRRRLAPLLGNDRRRIELMNALLLSLPGTPILYYGDEIGMGDNFYLGDRNGVRTPMQWSSDRNAGFSRANPQRLYLPIIIDPEYHYESANVEAQQGNPHSLLNWTRRIVALRKRHKAFGRGTIQFLHPSNHRVLCFVREWEDERILVVANLSRFVEYVELELGDWEGMHAVEVFSGRHFPPIGRLPYLLTLGPHAFYWFRIEAPTGADLVEEGARAAEPPVLRVEGRWDRLFADEAARESLEAALPGILRHRRWFGAKSSRIESCRVQEALALTLPGGSGRGRMLHVKVGLEGGRSETYSLPVAFLTGGDAERMRHERPGVVYAELVVDGREGEVRGWLVDGLEHPPFAQALLDAVGRRQRLRGERSEAVGSRTRAFRTLRGEGELAPHLMRGEQSNSSVVFGERLVLKVLRRLADGTNPDLEVGRFLTERTGFSRTAPVAGALEYQVPRGEPVTLAILHGYVPNEGDAWEYTLERVEKAYEDVLLRRHELEMPPARPGGLAALSIPDPPPDLVGELVGGYLETARLLGLRTAELHCALGSDAEDPAFAPEPLTTLFLRSQYQSARTQAMRSFGLLRRMAGASGATEEAARLLALEGRALEVLQGLIGWRPGGQRIRCHGDFHLGQVLYTGNDFAIIDFEGEPARSLSERRVKQPPLRDVAGMLRSFDYAAHTALLDAFHKGLVREEDVPFLEPWARFWRDHVGAAFLRAYMPPVSEAGLVPADPAQVERLLRVLLLDKCIYELAYELNNRPDWVRIPLRGALEILEADGAPAPEGEA